MIIPSGVKHSFLQKIREQHNHHMSRTSVDLDLHPSQQQLIAQRPNATIARAHTAYTQWHPNFYRNNKNNNNNNIAIIFFIGAVSMLATVWSGMFDDASENIANTWTLSCDIVPQVKSLDKRLFYAGYDSDNRDSKKEEKIVK